MIKGGEVGEAVAIGGLVAAPQADLDGDGDTDLADLAILLANYGIGT